MGRDTLTRERIVDAAIDLLDTEGLEALNMRALGARLGSAATAVYWHVGSKENLIALAGDRVWSDIALPDLAALDWRTAATQMATDLHTTLTQHLWLLQAFGSFLSFGPGRSRYADHSLAIYEAAGFAGLKSDQACATVFTFVLGSALGPVAAASLRRKLGADQLREGVAKARAVAAQLPRLRARLHTHSAEYAAGPDGSFEFGLHVILDGLESTLVAHRSKPPSPARKTRRAQR